MWWKRSTRPPALTRIASKREYNGPAAATVSEPHPGKVLAHFAATLDARALPDAVLRRAEDLMLDWFASALAGKQARPVEAIARFAERMGPAEGPSEVLIHRRLTSP